MLPMVVAVCNTLSCAKHTPEIFLPYSGAMQTQATSPPSARPSPATSPPPACPFFAPLFSLCLPGRTHMRATAASAEYTLSGRSDPLGRPDAIDTVNNTPAAKARTAPRAVAVRRSRRVSAIPARGLLFIYSLIGLLLHLLPSATAARRTGAGDTFRRRPRRGGLR